MASSSARWRLACDGCDAGAWLGARAGGFDAWCEACQTAQALAAAPGAEVRCPRCGAALFSEPRFVELHGQLQHLDAVLAAWGGDAAPLSAILPERPRFVSDLDPPAPRTDDPPARAAQLAALARGEWRAVLAVAADSDARSHAARAIAYERSGEPSAAIAEWDAALSLGEDARAHLARGALLARSGRHAEAGEDFARAGETQAARWDRASLLVHRAVAAGSGTPEPALVARARAEAGRASAYWSDPTVGRLLWSLLVEREAAGRSGQGGPAPSSRALLRSAENELEHSTFWDRSLVLLGWTRLDEAAEAARVARPLARGCIADLEREPALGGPELALVAQAVAPAREAVDRGDPLGARSAIAGALERDDLRRFRIPCARCRRGTVGVEEMMESTGL